MSKDQKDPSPFKVLMECGLIVHCIDCIYGQEHKDYKDSDGIVGWKWCNKKEFVAIENSAINPYLKGEEFTGLKRLQKWTFHIESKAARNGDGHCKYFEPTQWFRFKLFINRICRRKE